MLDPSRLPLNATTVGFRKRMHLEVDERAFAFELQRQTDCIKVRREEKETPISEVHVMGGQLFGIGGNSKTNEYARQQRQINGYALRHFSASGPIVLPPKHMDGLLQTPHNVGLTQYVPVGMGVIGGYVSQYTEPNVMHMEEGTAHEKKKLHNEMEQSHEDRQANIMKWDNRRSQAHQNRLAAERMGVRRGIPAQRQALNNQIEARVGEAPPELRPLVEHRANASAAELQAGWEMIQKRKEEREGRRGAGLDIRQESYKSMREALRASAEGKEEYRNPINTPSKAASPSVTTAAGVHFDDEEEEETRRETRIRLVKAELRALGRTNPDSPDEVARIKRQYDRLTAERDRLEREQWANTSRGPPSAAGPLTAYSQLAPEDDLAVAAGLNSRYNLNMRQQIMASPGSGAATPLSGPSSTFVRPPSLSPTFSSPLQSSSLIPPTPAPQSLTKRVANFFGRGTAGSGQRNADGI